VIEATIATRTVVNTISVRCIVDVLSINDLRRKTPEDTIKSTAKSPCEHFSLTAADRPINGVAPASSSFRLPSEAALYDTICRAALVIWSSCLRYLKDGTMNNRPIAVFDSGLGGLTVVRALQRQLPNESIVYFGDSARVPYGTKTSQTVLQFAEQNCHFLLRFDPKLIIVACNTASALALDELESRMPLPVLGVVKPGAAAAVDIAQGRGVAVLATPATVASEAYPRAIHATAPNTPVVQQQCPSLVALIEEGRENGDQILQLLISEYLDGVRQLEPAVVLLGCTHYPLVSDLVGKLIPRAKVVDSAQATAQSAQRLLAANNALSSAYDPGTLQCYVSDNPQRFREIGGRFLGRSIREVTWITPEQFFYESASVSSIPTS
jgi:glutamate racemase